MENTHALETLRSEMMACEQMENLSVLQHGEMVWDHYKALVTALRNGGQPEGDWRLPEWIHDPAILPALLPDSMMEIYTTYHDCGKPRVLVIGEEGRRHFPDHAAASERTWLELGGDPTIARLIGLDMEIHTIKDVDVAAFAARPEAISLILTGLSEIHANAAMFGGTDSTSFRIKYKQIDKRGKATLKLINKS